MKQGQLFIYHTRFGKLNVHESERSERLNTQCSERLNAHASGAHPRTKPPTRQAHRLSSVSPFAVVLGCSPRPARAGSACTASARGRRVSLPCARRLLCVPSFPLMRLLGRVVFIHPARLGMGVQLSEHWVFSFLNVRIRERSAFQIVTGGCQGVQISERFLLRGL